ncbi:hypothetical protein H2203_002520 [Taxawa tesnikishii (nom. ined.)]|nr:hypothetical protein H2203_002520 [Dothideales sp. JES 119]
MAAILGPGDGVPLEQWFFEMPTYTRWWTTAVISTGLLVQCHIITPFQLFYSFRAVFHKSQYWRLFTTFVYFGPLNFNLIFHIFFIQRYARMLEESAVSPAHFSWMLAYAATTIVSLAPLFSAAFLGSTLSSTLVYIWSRKHPDMQLSLLGLFVFKAPWLPWIMIALSVVLHGQWPKDELCGMVVGHIYYFFNDIYPAAHNGSRPLDPPAWWRRLFEREPLAPVTDGAVDRDVAAVAAPQVQ